MFLNCVWYKGVVYHNNEKEEFNGFFLNGYFDGKGNESIRYHKLK